MRRKNKERSDRRVICVILESAIEESFPSTIIGFVSSVMTLSRTSEADSEVGAEAVIQSILLRSTTPVYCIEQNKMLCSKDASAENRSQWSVLNRMSRKKAY